jgi:hypothetical protein
MATNAVTQESNGGDSGGGGSLPVRKVGIGALASALVTVGVWAAQQFGGVEIPSQVAAALTTVVGFAFAYLTPAGR